MFIFPIIASMILSFQFIPQKLLEKKQEIDPPKYNLSFTMGITCHSLLLCLVFTLILLFGYSILYPIELVPCVLAFISGCFWSIGNLFIIKGVEKIGISKTTIFMNSASIFTVIFAFFLFQESITPLMIIGLPLLIVSAIIVALIQPQKEDAPQTSPIIGYIFVIIGAFFFSIFNIVEQESVLPLHFPFFTAIPFFLATFLIGFGAFIAQLILNLSTKRAKEWILDWKAQRPDHNLAGFFAGIAWGSGILITVFSNLTFSLSFTIPILQSFMIIFTSVWGIIFFKEIRGAKKLLIFCSGCALSIIGVVLFSI